VSSFDIDSAKHAFDAPEVDSSPAAGSSAILDDAAGCLRELHGVAIEQLIVERVVVGVFFTAVMFSDGSTGVAYTPPESINRASTRILGSSPRPYRGRSASEMIDRSLEGPFAHVVRLAALNALSVPFLQQESLGATPGGDLSAIPELFAGRRVCMVGAIVPLLRKLDNIGASEIVIIDKKKETQEEAALGHFVPVEKTEESLASCQTAVFTGATIANGSIEELLSYVPKNSAIAVVGPTAGFVPTPLFRRGVAAVGTVAITEGGRVLEVVSEGGGGLHIFKNGARKINLINRPAMVEIGLLHDERMTQRIKA